MTRSFARSLVLAWTLLSTGCAVPSLWSSERTTGWDDVRPERLGAIDRDDEGLRVEVVWDDGETTEVALPWEGPAPESGSDVLRLEPPEGRPDRAMGLVVARPGAESERLELYPRVGVGRVLLTPVAVLLDCIGATLAIGTAPVWGPMWLGVYLYQEGTH